MENVVNEKPKLRILKFIPFDDQGRHDETPSIPMRGRTFSAAALPNPKQKKSMKFCYEIILIYKNIKVGRRKETTSYS